MQNHFFDSAEGYLRINQVLAIIPISRSTLYRGIKTGIYPKPVKISQRVSGWRISDIRRCMEAFDESTHPID
ncbi:MAG: AlpA family phage regulatory protein [Luteolibacter sp.]|uniref:helix-turn-helix transcriptional regulator n=1 Tax=Luteolibacter sp. TaxID=1962973 RepID=UPI003263CCFE